MEQEKIIQVVPCAKPMIGVYAPTEISDGYDFEWIRFIGLTADGRVVPIINCGGFLDSATMVRNYEGTYTVNNIKYTRFFGAFKAWKRQNEC